MLQGFKQFWQIIMSENNNPVIVGFMVAFAALFYAQVRIFFNNSKLLKAKDERIQDLVEQRSKFQNIALREKTLKEKVATKKEVDSIW